MLGICKASVWYSLRQVIFCQNLSASVFQSETPADWLEVDLLVADCRGKFVVKLILPPDSTYCILSPFVACTFCRSFAVCSLVRSLLVEILGLEDVEIVFRFPKG